MKKYIPLLIGALVVFGCGGGGGGGTVGSNATIQAYATDSFTDDYSHVWVKLEKVELVNGTTRQTLFEDAAGRSIDLRSLRDATGAKYSFLDAARVQTGTYTSIAVTLNRNLTLVPTGSTTGQARTFAAVHDVAGQPSKSLISYATPAFNAAGTQKLVVDFDLATWTVGADNRVTARCREGAQTGLDDHNRHIHDDFGGSVSGLGGASPNFTFTLLRGNGRHISVRTDATTNIFNESGAANPVMSNNLHVEVSGAFVSGILLASAIKIEDEGAGEDPHKIKGMATTVGTTQLDVNLGMAFGFTPDATTYRVSTNASTRYFSNAGSLMTQADFFAAITGPTMVEVEGTASAGGQFLATKLKLEHENENEVEIKGPITSVGANTFAMTAQTWFGANLTAGQAITVNLNGSTVYRLGNSVVNQSTFFASVGVGARVEAKGSLTGSTLTAIRVKDED